MNDSIKPKYVTPERLLKMQAECRARWADKEYRKKHGTITPELLQRWRKHFGKSLQETSEN